ncbi:MAG: hypothetical protein ACOC32_04605 [Nanoarchaeota archaeon]
MDAIDLVRHVEQDEQYNTWRKEHPDPFLAHVFLMYDGDKLMDQQVGYFNPNTSKMTSFLVSGEKITLVPEADVFQKPGSGLLPLDIGSVTASFDSVREKAEELLHETYETTASKKIFILQHLQEGQVWNITFLTATFTTINIRIEANTGDILKNEEINLIDFGKSG